MARVVTDYGSGSIVVLLATDVNTHIHTHSRACVQTCTHILHIFFSFWTCEFEFEIKLLDTVSEN